MSISITRMSISSLDSASRFKQEISWNTVEEKLEILLENIEFEIKTWVKDGTDEYKKLQALGAELKDAIPKIQDVWGTPYRAYEMWTWKIEEFIKEIPAYDIEMPVL